MRKLLSVVSIFLITCTNQKAKIFEQQEEVQKRIRLNQSLKQNVMIAINKWLDEQESGSLRLTEQRIVTSDSLQKEFERYDSIGTHLRKKLDSLEVELKNTKAAT